MSNIIFGKKSILDALKNKLEIEKIISSKPLNDKEFKGLKIEIVKPQYFNQFKDVNHQNIVAYLKTKINYLSLEQFINKTKQQKNVSILMVDENQDPRNFGSLIRTACAFNVDAIIFKNKNQSQVNDLVIKASLGSVFMIDLIKVANLNQSIDKLKEHGFWIYATGLTDKSQSLDKIKFDQKAVIIVGNEDKGVSDLTLKKSDFIIKIPMGNKVQSLNLATATGIVLYHLYLNQNN